jgi:hypothetical protein
MESGTIIPDVEFNELAAEAFEQGLYTGWSISIPRRAADGKRYIHHLALLGAVPPKIRDLKILQEMRRPVSADFADISASDTFCYTFSDQAKNEEGKVTDEEAKSLKEENKGLKEKIKNLEEKNGKEFADVSERPYHGGERNQAGQDRRSRKGGGREGSGGQHGSDQGARRCPVRGNA